LTVFDRDIKSKPDEVKRIIRAMQSAKDIMRKSKDRSVDLMIRLLKWIGKAPREPMMSS
jgi:hypothetical protein